MSEHAPSINNQSYKELHPDAIEDVDKAHFMAIESDEHETRVVRLRQKLAAHVLLASSKPYEKSRMEEHRGIRRQISDETQLADASANRAARAYDYGQHHARVR